MYGVAMRIHDILRRKGDAVVTITNAATVTEMVRLLTEHQIGAVVVSDADGEATGVVSERDVIRHLHDAGPAASTATVRDLMTAPPITCSHEDEVEPLARPMTVSRIRHMPVIVDGRPASMVS